MPGNSRLPCRPNPLAGRVLSCTSGSEGLAAAFVDGCSSYAGGLPDHLALSSAPSRADPEPLGLDRDEGAGDGHTKSKRRASIRD